MAANHSYDKSRIVLYENDADVCQTIEAALVQATFTQTLATSSLKTAHTAIINNEADLMVVDIDNEKNEICTLMRKIRHLQIGENPFPVSIALSSHTNIEIIQQAVNSGFDIILFETIFQGDVNGPHSAFDAPSFPLRRHVGLHRPGPAPQRA